MNPAFQCPKCGERVMLLIAPVFTTHARNFLAWTWVAKQPAGYLVRCTRHACGRDWRVGLDGLHEPAHNAIPGRGALPPSAPPPQRDERDEREPLVPLAGAIRRAEL